MVEMASIRKAPGPGKRFLRDEGIFDPVENPLPAAPDRFTMAAK